MIVRAAQVWTPWGVEVDHVVETDATGTITAVRVAREGDPERLPGLLVPGLVNAHTHLELCGVRTAPGAGMIGWVREVMARRSESTRAAAEEGARALVAAGTAVVCDVSNAGDSGSLLAAAGLAGVVQVEHLGFLREVPATMGEGAEEEGPGGPIRRRPTIHALHSTSPALLDAALAYDGPGSASPASVHVHESVEEFRFLRAADGPFAEFLDTLGRDWRWWEPPGRPFSWLADRGALGERLLVVHAVHTDPDDRTLLALTDTPVCLCPRSNRHIGGRLPDVPGLLAAGVDLCLGTDSLASSPDLDVLGEIPVLAEAFPDVAIDTWLAAATQGGADALGFRDYGRIAVGCRPGLVLLDVERVEDLAHGAPARRWIQRRGAP